MQARINSSWIYLLFNSIELYSKPKTNCTWFSAKYCFDQLPLKYLTCNSKWKVGSFSHWWPSICIVWWQVRSLMVVHLLKTYQFWESGTYTFMKHMHHGTIQLRIPSLYRYERNSNGKLFQLTWLKQNQLKKNSMHVSFKMFVKLLTDVNGLYIILVSAEMAEQFYNISAGCPMQIDFNLKHCIIHDLAPFLLGC